jgi:D-alanyl-D-alanine dipeptidase
MKIFLLSVAVLLLGASTGNHPGFGYVQEVIPSIVVEARYATDRNFTGRKVPGYTSSRIMLTHEALAALANVQAELKPQGLGLKVYDGYRPQRAVDSFVAWCADEGDTLTKRIYYPDLAKKDIIPNGYIWVKSGHTRGSTVDLTLVELATKAELDMGTPWDFFGPQSWTTYNGITAAQKANRKLLADVMKKHGFKPVLEEWWHFTLINEPYPDTYFDFVVE